MIPAVLVPRRSDHGRRDDVWRWVKQRWSMVHPDIPVIEGWHTDGPFNRSAAVNTAAENAGDGWTVAVIADSDSFVSPEAIEQAIVTAERTDQITFAHSRFRYLSESMSDQIMGGYVGSWEPGVEWSMDYTASSMVVVSRRLFDEMGGFDEGFIGWGMEDVGFSLACQAVGGGMQRIASDVWHLWHPVSPENDQSSPQFQANVERMNRYAACDYDRTATLDLLKELRS